MNKPFVSIVIPCYNAEAYLPTAIGSVVKQEEQNWELLLIDDGSTDRTPSICDDFALRDGRIRVFHKRNEGVSVSRNIGIEKANGEYVSFLDADDWFADTALTSYREAVKRVESDIYIFNNYQNKGKSEKKRPHFKDELFTRSERDLKWFMIDTLFPYYDELKNQIIVGNIRAVHGKLYRNSFLRENKLVFNKELSIAEDALFNFYAYKFARSVSMHDDYVLHYRISPISVMHKYNKDIDRTNDTIMKKFSIAMGRSLDEDEDFKIAYLGMAAECVFRSLKLNYLHPLNKDSFSERKKMVNKYISSPQISKALKYNRIENLPIGKKQMMWCFMHHLTGVGMLIGKLSMIYLKHKGEI